MGHRTLRHSLSQQNMQTISETPAEALNRVRRKLHSLLMQAAGQPTGSLHEPLGAWRSAVNDLLAEATAIAASAGGTLVSRTFGQVGLLTTEAGPPPNGPSLSGLTTDSDIIFTGAPFGTVPYGDSALGVWTLAANKTYRLSAHLQLGYSDPDGFATIYWTDDAGNILRDGQGDLVDTAYNNAGGGYSGLGGAELIYTVGDAPIGVKLRVIDISAGTVDVLYGSNAVVQEL